MNWDAIGAGAELLGAIGVILTLIYLARQIRHNSQQIKGSSTVAVHEFQNGLTDQLLAQPELFQLILRANFEWETITDDELRAKYSECYDMNEPGAAMILACENYKRECDRRAKELNRYIC